MESSSRTEASADALRPAPDDGPSQPRPAARRLRAPRPVTALTIAAAVLLLAGLDTLDLWAPDEPRYAQIAEEVRAMHGGATDLFLLHLGGEPYTQKPPLYYWLAAAIGAPGGRVTEWAARLPSALAGLLVLWATALLARTAFADRASGRIDSASIATLAICSVGVLLTVFRFTHLARRAQLDVLLTLWECSALLAYWRLRRGDGSRTVQLWWLHGSLGLAMLTKGPVGLLPLAVIAAHLAWEGRLGDFRRIWPVRGLAISALPIGLWIASAVWLAPEGFFQAAVVDNLLGRFASGTAHVRPFYYFAYQLPLDFLPWTLFWPFAIHAAWRARTRGTRGAAPLSSGERFALAWIGVFIVFFSLSAGKRGLYLLPAFPAIALLCGHALERMLTGAEGPPRWVRLALGTGAAALAACGVAVMAAGLARWSLAGVVPPPIAGALLTAIGVTSLGAGAVVGRQSRARLLGTVVAAGVAVQAVLFLVVFPAIDPEKSPRPIARAAAGLVPEGGRIGIYRQRPLSGGILYYGDRGVVNLEEPAEAARYLASGGRAIVARASADDLRAQLPELRVEARFRQGEREVHVLRPPP